jgi:predicted Rossmann fold flavoprotein
MKMVSRVIVIGGGAAGFFGAIAAAESGLDVTILEASQSVLGKVRISGGGRCNVTHACFDPKSLVASYPRGGKELRGPLSRFQPQDTVRWFASRGVRLKTESDGRMFPTSDNSSTIVNCLCQAADRAGVVVRTQTNVTHVQHRDHQFSIELGDGSSLLADQLLLATGGGRRGFELAHGMGHEIIPPVPSLFTFQISDPRLDGLAGVSVEEVGLRLVIGKETLRQTGPLLITHWGVSGPAVLKLSAWGARELFNSRYQARLIVGWLPGQTEEAIGHGLLATKRDHAKRGVLAVSPFELPRRLWSALVTPALPSRQTRWADVSKSSLRMIVDQLVNCEFEVSGKGVFKEEFVTCGGVNLKEVDLRSMQSRLRDGLYFAGEILDIDGITGGFNFQNAWTTAWIAGNAMQKA